MLNHACNDVATTTPQIKQPMSEHGLAKEGKRALPSADGGPIAGKLFVIN